MIYLKNTTRRLQVRERRLRSVAERLLEELGCDEASLAITLVGDRAMRSLNRAHRGRDRPTDVLSFPLFEPGAVPTRRRSGGPEVLLGDVVISVDTAERQAAEYGVPYGREIERLLIHGLLHLMGHDHELPQERTDMAAAERRLARAIGMPWPQGYRSGL